MSFRGGAAIRLNDRIFIRPEAGVWLAAPRLLPDRRNHRNRGGAFAGFSLTKETRKILASLSEGGNRYTVEQGDYLLGRYRVTRITESLVEIEDVQQKGRGTFTISH